MNEFQSYIGEKNSFTSHFCFEFMMSY